MFLSRRGLELSSVTKFVLGLVLLGLGFVVMVGAASMAGSETGRVSAMWLVGAYYLHTIGELCLSPIGLSLVTKLAPARLGGMLMGVWFFATFLGNKAAGMVGELYSEVSHVNFFMIFVGTSLAAAALLFALKGTLKKLMAGAA
jgi:POT family proton-dependent oligopeptide transporter